MEEHVIVDSSFSAPIDAPLEKSLPIGFTSDNSRSGVVDIGTPGR
jgi:hypothetical protein